MKDVIAYVVISALIALAVMIILRYDVPAAIMSDDYTPQFRKLGAWVK